MFLRTLCITMSRLSGFNQDIEKTFMLFDALNFQQGYLGTYDEETSKFFEGSSVQVILCPRSGSKGHSLIKQQVFGLNQCSITLFHICTNSHLWG